MDAIGSYGGAGSIDHAKMRQEMFNKIDTDGDGQFSLEEFEAAKPADAPEDAPSASEMFSQIDSDGDGFVSEEEFGKAPPPPPPPGGGGMMGSDMMSSLLQALEEYSSTTESEEEDDSETTTVSETDEESETSTTTEADILELIQSEMENFRNSAFSQAQNAYSNASGLGAMFAQQQTLASL
ncbi:EF-hand domain-containing protein [Terasakiella sp. SH-1]|uniref:EF-hand domain-containing protein n=1 Tax=Terasakiella sp. SH-1 TaxID=2560057 RepID=UPI001981EBE5|nr:EF-hand domain-containing protein [Terasakiella sp. SH-1]